MKLKHKLVRIIREIGSQFNHMDEDKRSATPITLLREKAIKESYEFILPHSDNTALFTNKAKLQTYALSQALKNIKPENLLIEAGVFKGTSINHMAKQLTASNITNPIYGFDSFEGLEEDWKGQGMLKGFFSLNGKLPSVCKNVNLYKGWVQDTIPTFLKNNNSIISFLHMDLDTYTPSKYVLKATKNRVTSGTIILFDELHGYPGWRNEEFLALNEVYKETEYEFIGFAPMQAAIRIK